MILLLLTCLACEGGIPLSTVEGPVVPGSSAIPAELQLPLGRLSSHIEGPNTPITGENIKEAAEGLFFLIRMNIRRPLDLDTIPGTFNAPDTRFEFFDFGRSLFTGSFIAELTNDVHYRFNGDYTVELNDWSRDSKQFFGGGLKIEMIYSAILNADDAFGTTASVSGDVVMGGTYSGRISFLDFRVLRGSFVDHYEGEIQVISNGVQTNYYLDKYCETGDCQWIEH